MDRFLTFLEKRTVKYLTKRKAEKAYEHAKKHTVLSEIWSWVDALIFAIFWVIIINQYLFQLFLIPSPSMVPTLNVGDRVVVNKDAYGVELYPAGKKVATGTRRVQRDEIITFYNPEYTSKGPAFDILSQVVYMGTLTLVNIDRNEDGTPAERLYVKRAVGFPGDVIRFAEGNVMIRPSGAEDYVTEEAFRADNSLSTGPVRSIEPGLYKGLKAASGIQAYNEAGIAKEVPSWMVNDYGVINNTSYNYIFDRYEFEKGRTHYLSSFDPSDMSRRSDAAKYENGIYVPSGYVLPLGDNRDNSHDGRYFGPVEEKRINGRVIARFWPLKAVSSLMDNE